MDTTTTKQQILTNLKRLQKEYQRNENWSNDDVESFKNDLQETIIRPIYYLCGSAYEDIRDGRYPSILSDWDMGDFLTIIENRYDPGDGENYDALFDTYIGAEIEDFDNIETEQDIDAAIATFIHRYVEWLIEQVEGDLQLLADIVQPKNDIDIPIPN